MRAAPDTRPSVGLSILSLFFVFGTILVLNPVGNVLNAVVWGDLRTLIGIPIGVALILYLARRRTRAQFDTRALTRLPEDRR